MMRKIFVNLLCVKLRRSLGRSSLGAYPRSFERKPSGHHPKKKFIELEIVQSASQLLVTIKQL